MNYSLRIFGATQDKMLLFFLLSRCAVEHNAPSPKSKQEYPSYKGSLDDCSYVCPSIRKLQGASKVVE